MKNIKVKDICNLFDVKPYVTKDACSFEPEDVELEQCELIVEEIIVGDCDIILLCSEV